MADSERLISGITIAVSILMIVAVALSVFHLWGVDGRAALDEQQMVGLLLRSMVIAVGLSAIMQYISSVS